MSAVGPTVVRRQLGRRPRELRNGTGMTVDEVTSDRYLGISRAKLFRLEAGKHSVKPQDVTILCGQYGITAREEVKTLQALALATQDRSWWHIYGEGAVPEWCSLFVDLEPMASVHRTYEVEVVPGLLQTRTTPGRSSGHTTPNSTSTRSSVPSRYACTGRRSSSMPRPPICTP